MERLLEVFSISEIITFIILLAIAIRGATEFLDWAYVRCKKIFDKEYKRDNFEESVNQRFEEDNAKMEIILENQKELSKSLEEIHSSINGLIESDKDDIKAFITREHHYFMRMGWIDDYSLDCVERRFLHYKQEGGNSYIEDLMKDIRKLPKVSPNNNNINN